MDYVPRGRIEDVRSPYVNGEPHGTQIIYYEDGLKKRQVPWEEGKQHGTELWYFKDGSSKTSAEWVHGTGTQIWYHEDGSKWVETPYVDGQQHGTVIWYKEDGAKLREIVYENGEFITEKKLKEVAHEKPAKEQTSMKAPIREVSTDELEKHEEIWYLKGETEPFTGTEIFYYKDGSKRYKRYETPYVNGEKHGTEIEYREDGSVESEVPYVNGKPHGTAILYRKDGSKKEETVYENGKIISVKNF